MLYIKLTSNAYTLLAYFILCCSLLCMYLDKSRLFSFILHLLSADQSLEEINIYRCLSTFWIFFYWNFPNIKYVTGPLFSQGILISSNRNQ